MANDVSPISLVPGMKPVHTSAKAPVMTPGRRDFFTYRDLGITEGSAGKMRLLPTGALGKAQAEYAFGPSDFRFTVGNDGALYVFTLATPKPGEKLKVQSLCTKAALWTKPVSKVTLLGSAETLKWSQTADSLEITAPRKLPAQAVVAFRVE